jgi:hypothetical protein
VSKASTDQFKPFADDSASTSIGGLNLENGQGAIAIYGNLSITRDQKGLLMARQLAAAAQAIANVLEAEKASLPEVLAAGHAPLERVANPFQQVKDL